MKRYIITLFLIIGFSISAMAQQTNSSESQNCEEYKNGFFTVQESIVGKKYIIKRRGKRQVETDPDGTKFIFKVNWKDDCTYTLKLKRIAKNPKDIKWQEGQLITVNILETDNDGYIQESTSNIDNMTFKKYVTEVNRREAKDYLEDAEISIAENEPEENQ